MTGALTRAAIFLGAVGAGSACAANYPGREVSSAMWNTLSGTPPIVIAHRGASAFRPPHTLEGYELGVDLGADFIEPDLVLTRDDVLVCRHDRYLGSTTNVADHPEFADRRVEKGGRTDWWVEDFTLEEIRTLRARQDNPRRSTEYDDRFLIPTFEEVIALARRKTDETGRVIGIYPEPKRAAEFAAMGKDLTTAVVAALEKAGWTGPDAPVIVQSFETPVLEALDKRIDVPLVQLVSARRSNDPGAPPESEIELEGITAYADGVGPGKGLIVGEDGRVSDFVERAHALGLWVHVWTLAGDRDSPDGLSPEDETRRLYDLGVDGVFADDPGQAVRIRQERESPG
ncbi:MAG: glycerophosphodiester phosphodiesterase family protein [Gemmatimonadota bacterium]